MGNLRLIKDDGIFLLFVDYFQGIPVRILKNKYTEEIKFMADDVARCLGYDSLHDLLSSDEGLDYISNWKKEHNDIPLFGNSDSGSMFEQITI